MKNKKVALVKGKNRKQNIIRALSLIKNEIAIKGKKLILIKPNLTATSNPYANTDVEAVEAVIEFLNDNFRKKKIVVGDGSGSAFYDGKTTREVTEKFGYLELERKFDNVRIECFDEFYDFFSVPVQTVSGMSEVNIIKRARDFDYKISVGIPKMHNYAIATFGVKNMLGLIKQEDKSLIHGMRSSKGPDAKKTLFDYIPTSAIARARRRFPKLVNTLLSKSKSYSHAVKIIHRNVANTAKEVFPDLVVLDCFYGMEGNGPIDGIPVKLSAAITSADALKADGVGARIIGLNPEEIGYLYYLKERGYGDLSLSGLVGNKIENVCVEFRPHQTYNIQKNWR